MNKSQSFCLPTCLYSSQTLENSYSHTTIHCLSSFQKIENEGKKIQEGDDQLETFSTKKLRPPIEMSFQKSFLREHKATFYHSFQKYKEYLRINEHNLSKKSALGQIKTRSDLQHPTISSLLEESHFSLNQFQRKQFLKDLLFEQKLSQFLESIVQTLSPEQSTKFILMAQSIWSSFIPHQIHDLQVNDLIKLGGEIAEDKLVPKFKAFFTENHKNPEHHEVLTHFFKTYCITILLILGQFFENPFYKEQVNLRAPKRALMKDLFSQLSDSEEKYVDLEPIKKHKPSK